MHNLLRYYRQNRKKIIYYTLFIIFIFIIIKNAGNIFYQENNSNKNDSTYEDNQVKNYSKESKSIISNGKVNSADQNTYGNLIDMFLQYCSSDQIQEAYNLISEDCKEEMFPNINEFKNNYINTKFNGNKTYSFQSWSNQTNIYYVKIFEDALSSGQASTNYGDDYIRIIKENGENKLNINSFIGKRNVNSSTEQNGIKILINYSKIYKDYEVYSVTITNNTQNTILLDSRESDSSIYLLNENEVKLSSWLYENNQDDFIIQPGETKTINIKFGFVYNEDYQLKEIVFEDIVLNYQKYLSESGYDEKTEISVQF